MVGTNTRETITMAKNLSAFLLSGRIGNLIYYIRNGKQYVRRVAIPGKTRKWETEGRTAKQKTVVGRFAIVQAFYSAYSSMVSPEIWRLVARAEGRTAPNLFNSTNCKCFDGKGQLVDYEKMKFTRGNLLLPRKIRVTSEGLHCRVTWEEERNWETAAPSDRLCVGVLYDANPLGPSLALNVSGCRADLCGDFMLDATMGVNAHVYCFFAREDGSAFSDSWYARIENN